jgi:hypothetical protein
MIIVYMMAAWFLILLFSNKNYFLCSIVILLSSLTNIIIVDVLNLTGPLSYIAERGFLIKLDGLTAVILTTLYAKDKLAFKMSLLLVFSVLCHTMIIYDITVHSSFVTNVFYNWYDELIMTIGILQMVISSDGLTSALRNIQLYILRISFYSWCIGKGISSHKRRGERA